VTPLRVVVIDDEELAREGLVEQLSALADTTVVGAYADGLAALRAMPDVKPDVVCVDIRMPGMNGLEVARALAGDDAPAVIFVTAYDAFAIEAFELNAVDYLLKPVTAERLAQAIDRVRRRDRSDGSATADRLVMAIQQLESRQPQGIGRLIVREVGQVIVIATRDVDWIEGADYYVKLHVREKSYMLRETLASLETRLDPARFFRVHRSGIVNLTRVTSVKADARGDGVIVLTTGARLRVTQSRRPRLEKMLEALHDTP
jgi:two-component system LytT family response regulator